MADDRKPRLEVPEEVRNLASSSVGQARRAFDRFMAAAREAVAQADRQSAGLQPGAPDMNRRILGFAEKNVDAALDLAARLAQAQDAQEMMRLQTEFMQKQAASMSEQMRALAESAAQAAGTATKD